MSLLYTIVNLCLPMGFLSYKTVSLMYTEQPLPFGRWFCLLVLIPICYSLQLFFDLSLILLLFDLILKAAVIFSPNSINVLIQNSLSRLHLETVVQHFRGKIVNALYNAYARAGEKLLNLFNEAEKRQFIQCLQQRLNGELEKQTIVIKQKKYDTVGVECDILSAKIASKVENAIPLTPKLSRQMEMQPVRDPVKVLSRVEKAKAIQEPPTKLSEVSSATMAPKKLGQSSTLNNPQEKHEQVQKNIQNRKAKNSQQLYDSRDFSKQEIARINPPTFKADKIEHKYNRQNTLASPVYSSTGGLNLHMRQNNERPTSTLNTAKRPSMGNYSVKSVREEDLVEKINLSVSDYHDLFEDENEYLESSISLVCKVESIVEIGSRLEIYNLELYSNSDIRIVSLYGREFERHKLIEMTKSNHQYYELSFSGGEVQKRRVKFRGDYGAFFKYIKRVI